MIMNRIANYTLGIEVLGSYNEESSANREIWINGIMLGGMSDMEALYQNAEVTDFEYRSAEDFGYVSDVLVNVGQENGAIKFSWVGGSEDFVKFWMQNLSGIVQITLKRQGKIIDQRTVNLYTAEHDQVYTYEMGELERLPVQYSALQYGTLLFVAILVFLAIVRGLAILMLNEDKRNER